MSAVSDGGSESFSATFDSAFTQDDHFFHQGYLTDDQADHDASELLGLLALSPRSKVLDAGCGDGRLAVRLAALGFVVVGVDCDGDQLARARRASRARGVEVTWVHADLAQRDALSEHEPFDGAALWFNTWGFASDLDNESILRSVTGAVRAGGTVVIDTFDRDRLLDALDAEDGPVELDEAGQRQVDRTSFDPIARRFVTVRMVSREGETRTRVLRQRLLVLSEWEQTLDELGFDLVSATSRAGTPLGDGLELVMAARRRG